MSEPDTLHSTVRRLTVPLTTQSMFDAASIGITELRGDAMRAADAAMPIDRATSNSVTFCTRDGERGATLINASNAGVVLCLQSAADLVTRTDVTLLVTSTPRLSFARLLTQFFVPSSRSGRHPTAWVHPNARVADDVYLGAYVVVDDDCEIGPGSVLHAHVCLYPGSRIGARVTLHSGVIIGADGFGHERNAEGRLEKFPQLGGVQIGNDVEIGANSCVSCGTLTDTIIESGVRMDNLVHIAHNVTVGADAVLTANAMVAGSARIGARAWIAPSASIMDGGVSIGTDAIVGMGAVVLRSVADNAIVVGNPARALDRKTQGAA